MSSDLGYAGDIVAAMRVAQGILHGHGGPAELTLVRALLLLAQRYVLCGAYERLDERQLAIIREAARDMTVSMGNEGSDHPCRDAIRPIVAYYHPITRAHGHDLLIDAFNEADRRLAALTPHAWEPAT